MSEISDDSNGELELNIDSHSFRLVDYEDDSSNSQGFVNERNKRKVQILDDKRVGLIDKNKECSESLESISLDERQNTLMKHTEGTLNKLSNVVDKMSNVMSGANAMLNKISEISKSTLEAERIRLHRLEIQRSMQIGSTKKCEKENRAVDNNVKEHNKINDNQEFLTKSMQSIKKTIETEFNSSKINIKREYKLTQKSNFELWMDYLNSELQSNDLLDVIDSNIDCPANLSENVILKRKSLVRDIIINHLDENYHKRILSEKEPKEILKKLRGFKKGETNVTHTSVRARLYQIKMRKGEKVIDFCERFDTIVREYEVSEDAVPLTEQEKRSSFYQAVSSVIPELRNADLIRRQTSMKEMNLEEIKSFITQLEAEKTCEFKDEPKVQRVFSQSHDSNNRCHRCNNTGHWANDCSLQGTGKWFCYYCQSIRTHKGADCQLAKHVKKGGFRDKSTSSNIRDTERKYVPKTDNRGKIWKNGRNKGNIGAKFVSSKIQSVKSSQNQQKESGKIILNKEQYKPIDKVTFIADSGATDHIVNTSLILSEFKKSNEVSIKSANKNQIADIKIDGKGNLLLCTQQPKGNIIKLANVISAKDISENLLSLRRFVDGGFCIYLDDQILRVFDKQTNDTILEGVYEKPNWKISFVVMKGNTDLEREYENYECKARVVSKKEFSDLTTTVITRVPINVDTVDLEKLEDLYGDDSIEKKVQKSEKFSDAMLWHMRLGHASLNYLKKLQKIESKLEGIKFDESILECEVCILAKMTKYPFKNERNRAERSLQIIHTDTMGPIKPTSFPGQKRYIVVFVDDYSRLARAYSTKSKDESGISLERFLISGRNLLGKDEKVCYIRSDQGTEFMGGKFTEILEREKIESDPSPPYTPEHNGVAERFNQTIQGKVRSYMFDSGLPKTMWEFAVEAAVHAYNRTPHKSIDYEVPLKRFAPNENVHFEQIKRFGCIGYVKVPKPNAKFDERAIKAVLVGYTSTGYILWHPSSGKYLESRNVRFNEKIVYKNVYQTKELKQNNSDKIESNKDKTKDEQTLEGKIRRPMTRAQTKREKNMNLEDENLAIAYFSDPGKIIQDIDLKNKEDDDLSHAFLATINEDPITYQDALESKDKENWKKAIQEEIDSMNTNNVWNIVDKPTVMLDGTKANIIDSKWVFKRKQEENGATRFKARLVIRGFKDKREYDLRETYAPVSRLPVVRLVLAIINKYQLFACQLDVKTAFLNGILEEEFYMKIPDGVTTNEEVKQTKVCKLKKSLYGLKISPQKWNKRFTEEVRKFGLENDVHEPCLFTWRKDGKLLVLILYVDDMLVASNDEHKLQEIISRLGEVFDMKNLGAPRNFLGIIIERNKEQNSMKLHQEKYVESMLERFNMKDCKPQNTPMVTRRATEHNKKRKLEQTNHNELQTENLTPCKAPYREAIGSLMYLANATRPDIAFAVNYLARKQLEPTESDWVCVKRVFRYLRGTSNVGLIYKGTGDNLEVMTDASFRDCEDSTSTSGYVISLFKDVISWRSRKQSYVTLSTCQAEYLAMSEACQEIISLDKGMRFIIGQTFFPVIIWCDNRAAKECTEKNGSHKLKMFDDSIRSIKEELEERERTGTRKHMADTHGDFVKTCVNQNIVKVMWINTKENNADIMTKPLPLESHKYLRDKMFNQSEI